MASRRVACAAFVLGLALVAAAPTARAQTPPAPTNEQRQLYEDAFAAFNRADYTSSIELLRRAIAVRSYDLFELALGRALQRAGSCTEARDALDRALTSPTIGTPPRGEIAARAREYRAELDERCPGSVRFACDPGVEVALGAEPFAPCPPEGLSLPPGTYRVRLRRSHVELTSVVTVRAFEVSELQVAWPRTPTAPTIAATPRDASPETAATHASATTEIRPTRAVADGPTNTAPLWLGAASLGLVGGAVLVDTILYPDARDDFRARVRAGAADARDAQQDASTLQTVALVAYGVGFAALAASAAWWLLDDDEPGSSSTASLSVSARGASLTVRSAF